MQIITLSPQDFNRHAELLAKAIENGDDTHYDAIIAIRRGGSIVCDAMLRHFSRSRYGKRYDMELQRQSTKHKKSHVWGMLRSFPYPVLDVMRKIEATLLRLIKKAKGAAPQPEVDIPTGLADILAVEKPLNILVIDDAIDSGDTLFAIVETLKKTNPKVRIMTAVITETTRKPRIRAHYTLYRNRTLIRFPWSIDYKNP